MVGLPPRLPPGTPGGVRQKGTKMARECHQRMCWYDAEKLLKLLLLILDGVMQLIRAIRGG